MITLLKKDLKLIFFRKQGIKEALLLGLIIIFTFSLASSNLGPLNPIWVGTIFWVSSIFCSVLIFRELYEMEERHKVWELLLISPISIELIWVSKTICGIICLFFLQIFFMVFILIFLKSNIMIYFFPLILNILIIDWGMGVIGSFFGGAVGDLSTKDSLLTTILFPLQLPIILGGIKTWSHLSAGNPIGEIMSWINMSLAFDLIFTGVCLFLFPFLYGKE